MRLSDSLPIDWVLPGVLQTRGGPNPGLGALLGFADIVRDWPGWFSTPVRHEVDAAMPNSQLVDGVAASLTKGVG